MLEFNNTRWGKKDKWYFWELCHLVDKNGKDLKIKGWIREDIFLNKWFVVVQKFKYHDFFRFLKSDICWNSEYFTFSRYPYQYTRNKIITIIEWLPYVFLSILTLFTFFKFQEWFMFTLWVPYIKDEERYWDSIIWDIIWPLFLFLSAWIVWRICNLIDWHEYFVVNEWKKMRWLSFDAIWKIDEIHDLFLVRKLCLYRKKYNVLLKNWNFVFDEWITDVDVISQKLNEKFPDYNLEKLEPNRYLY
ncbi:MAG: hypothetical protein ACD_71C00094G0003 [uncultured bacterium (gcode 4)]|uniref:Uncharacterized protein n=1 Tax=uncultured bacterium (gcode 4) TaxID=1234023 RepID=K1Z4Z3_9BACT|nr:MAG: hypothetical protein ACD_71C00094G0003 [uncultured bacterium (gcode 4)]